MKRWLEIIIKNIIPKKIIEHTNQHYSIEEEIMDKLVRFNYKGEDKYV